VVPVAFLTTVPAEAMLVVQLGLVSGVLALGLLFVARVLAVHALSILCFQLKYILALLLINWAAWLKNDDKALSN